MDKARRFFKYHFIRFKRLRGDPHFLALGTAIGVFIGLTPTMPFHTVLIIVAALITKSSALAGITISWIICNPLTYFPIYYFSVQIGNFITPHELSWNKMQGMLQYLVSDSATFASSIKLITEIGYETCAVLLAGGVLFALPFGILSYYLSFSFFLKIKTRKREKHILN